MGCTSSKDIDARGAGTHHYGGEESGPLSRSAVEGRIDCIEETRVATFGNLKVRYGYLSQRGYYPDDANKANQDSYSVTTNFSGQESDALFAVYDGHGRYGDKCAQFARDHLPNLISKHVKKAKRDNRDEFEELTKEETQTVCSLAHKQCNTAMHNSQELDDNLSGTTAISCYIHGRRKRITVCNVGDSRAVLGQRVRRRKTSLFNSDDDMMYTYRALPLSRDQTPYRRDERKRIRATGARIMSLDQIEGLEPINDDEDDMNSQWSDDGELELGEEIDEGGDPPRVWSPHGDYPGTAFTRSLGDSIAEELGVSAEPEMVTRELSPDDEIVVLASDGVFEFLTNQSVIDICAKFKDPLAACRAVVAESYELWLQYELRTDDITMICLFIEPNDINKPSPQRHNITKILRKRKLLGRKSESSTKDDTIDAPVNDLESKPVRSRQSKEMKNKLEEMRKGIEETDLDEDIDINTLYTEKTDEEKAGIAEAIKTSVMFQNITDKQRNMIYGVMEPVKVKKGDWIIRQGTVGDRFYIIDYGSFEVRIVPKGAEDDDNMGGDVVHVYEGSREKQLHPSFGELSLMYSAPRAASIIARTDGQLWALHRYAFRKVLAQRSGRQDLLKLLVKIDALRDYDLKNVIGSMEEFGKGKTIVRQNDGGDVMYVIAKGSCDRFDVFDGDEITSSLKADDYFGEEVIGVNDSRYQATVVATSHTNCWKIHKNELVLKKKGSKKKKS